VFRMNLALRFMCQDANGLLTLSLTATVQKIVSEILPPSAGIAFGKDARDLLIECCVEFITLISSEANEISEKEAKKTIACEHVTKALEQLGFGAYVADILEVASEHKEQLKVYAAVVIHYGIFANSDRAEKRKLISLSRVVSLLRNCLRFRKGSSGRLLSVIIETSLERFLHCMV